MNSASRKAVVAKIDTMKWSLELLYFQTRRVKAEYAHRLGLRMQVFDFWRARTASQAEPALLACMRINTLMNSRQASRYEPLQPTWYGRI